MATTPNWQGKTGGGTVELDVSGSSALGRLGGKLDHALVAALEARLPERGPVILDLASVNYVSSSGLAGLARLSGLRDLRLACLARGVRDVVDLAGLDRLLRIFEDVAQAEVAAPSPRPERAARSL